MNRIEKFHRWISRHERKVYICIVVVIVILDISLIVDYYFQTESSTTVAIITRIMAGVSTTLYAFGGLILFRKRKLERFFTSIFKESEDIYFHGFKFSRYLDTDAILRLEKWLGQGMCYELSALAMILMKDCKSAKLCRGDYYDKNGNFQTKHAWVEVRIPFNGWYVIDFAWIFPGFCRKSDYFRRNNDGGKLICKWTCTHDEFWSIHFSNVVREAMQNRKTSCVLLELSGFGGPENGYGFRDYIYEMENLKFSDGSVMLPHCRDDSDKPISSRIIRDFVKNPKRKDPKAKSIRLAKIGMHKYEVWKAQQAVA